MKLPKKITNAVLLVTRMLLGDVDDSSCLEDSGEGVAEAELEEDGNESKTLGREVFCDKSRGATRTLVRFTQSPVIAERLLRTPLHREEARAALGTPSTVEWDMSSGLRPSGRKPWPSTRFKKQK